MNNLQSSIDRYGPIAGPRLYHALQSRAAYIGANRRLRDSIGRLAGAAAKSKAGPSTPADRPTPLFDSIHE